MNKKDDAKYIRTSLQRTYINIQQLAKDNKIYHKIYPLKSCLWGFVYKSRFDSYLVIINQNLTKEMQKEVFCHEVAHIMYDMSDTGYIIGLDMQYENTEKEANIVSEAVGSIFF